MSLCQLECEDVYKLEEHLRIIHDKNIKHSCEHCEMGFVTQQSLRNHMKTQHKQVARTCHFFNNEKECPYLEIGCKFEHSQAQLCKYKDICHRKNVNIDISDIKY